MITDVHYQYMFMLRSGISYVSVPLQYVVDYPMRVIGWVRSLVSSKTQIVNENMHLRYQLLIQESQLQKFRVLQQENSQLKELLKTANHANFRSVAAHVLAVETDSGRQLLTINQGKRASVYVGQPVLDAKGVVGQIVEVRPFSSVVLMISDAKSAIPVRNYRTGERAIVVGNNDIASLTAVHLPRTTSFKAGDLLVTSGLAKRYPEGMPVGRVSNVHSSSGEAFLTAEVKPNARLNFDRLVLIVWPESVSQSAMHATKRSA